MINGINSGYYSSYQASSTSFDYATVVSDANKKAQELLNTLTGNKTTVNTMQKDTSSFLNSYASTMRSLDQSTEKLRNGNLEKLLYDKNGEVTDETLKNTVDAVKNMITQYNDTIKLLNDNADRGPGIKKQLARMVGVDPAPEASMNMIGMSVNKDGTFELDEEKFMSAFKTQDSNQLELLSDILGGHNGIADKVHVNTIYGSNMSSWQLVGNDVANIRSVQDENPFREMYNAIKGNAYALNNMAYSGLFLNMLA